jgi:PhnB protein
MADVKPIPDGHPQVVPYLCVEGADRAIQFYSEVFSGREHTRMDGPDGTTPRSRSRAGG